MKADYRCGKCDAELAFDTEDTTVVCGTCGQSHDVKVDVWLDPEEKVLFVEGVTRAQFDTIVQEFLAAENQLLREVLGGAFEEKPKL